MNDVEKLAIALQQADAELDLESPDLGEAVEHAHRRLVGRLLLVGVLSALGATLLLTGGLEAGAAIKRSRENKTTESTKTKPHKEKHGKRGGEGKHGGGERNGGGQQKGKGQRKDQDHAGVGPGKTEQPRANLVVTELTSGEVTVENISEVDAGPFRVVVLGSSAEEEPVEEEVEFDGLAAEEEASRKFEKEIECVGELVAEVDYYKEVPESDENDNERSTDCPSEPGEDEKEPEGPEGGQTTESETRGEKSGSTVTPAGAGPP